MMDCERMRFSASNPHWQVVFASLFDGCGHSAALNSMERSRHAHEFMEFCLDDSCVFVRYCPQQHSVRDRLRDCFQHGDGSHFRNHRQQDHNDCRQRSGGHLHCVCAERHNECRRDVDLMVSGVACSPACGALSAVSTTSARILPLPQCRPRRT